MLLNNLEEEKIRVLIFFKIEKEVKERNVDLS